MDYKGLLGSALAKFKSNSYARIHMIKSANITSSSFNTPMAGVFAIISKIIRHSPITLHLEAVTLC